MQAKPKLRAQLESELRSALVMGLRLSALLERTSKEHHLPSEAFCIRSTEPSSNTDSLRRRTYKLFAIQVTDKIFVTDPYATLICPVFAWNR